MVLIKFQSRSKGHTLKLSETNRIKSFQKHNLLKRHFIKTAILSACWNFREMLSKFHCFSICDIIVKIYNRECCGKVGSRWGNQKSFIILLYYCVSSIPPCFLCKTDRKQRVKLLNDLFVFYNEYQVSANRWRNMLL